MRYSEATKNLWGIGNGRTNGCVFLLGEGLNMTYVIEHLEDHNFVMNPEARSC